MESNITENSKNREVLRTKSVSFEDSRLLRKTSSDLLIKPTSPEAPRKNQGGWYIVKRVKSDGLSPLEIAST